MTEAFAHPGLRVRHAEALTLLRALPDASIDHVITDPPYTEDVHEHQKSVWFSQGEMRKAYTDLTFASLDVQGYEFVAEMLRVSRRWVLCFCALEQLGVYQAAARAVHATCYVRGIVVRKTQATPQITGDRPRQAAEAIAVLHRRGKKRWNGGGGGGWYDSPRAAQKTKDRLHPNQKNLSLMRALVTDFTDAGEAILDPFAGSGTTGLAALIEGRRAILADSDPACVATMHARFLAEWPGWAAQLRGEGLPPMVPAGGAR